MRAAQTKENAAKVESVEKMTHEQLLAAKRETEAKHRALKQEAERVALGAGACGRQSERARS